MAPEWWLAACLIQPPKEVGDEGSLVIAAKFQLWTVKQREDDELSVLDSRNHEHNEHL